LDTLKVEQGENKKKVYSMACICWLNLI
jgi:hypothetical protein